MAVFVSVLGNPFQRTSGDNLVRIAIFGGTFDPVHEGHLRIARHITRLFSLDQVLFITAARPPHKSGAPLTSACDRHAMVALALRDEKKFIPSNIELLSARSKNYSIDTITKIRRRLRPSDELFFIMGADQFAEFRTWRSSDLLLTSVSLIVISRPGFSLDTLLRQCDDKIRSAFHLFPGRRRRDRKAMHHVFAKPPAVYLLSGLKIDISSTAIRARIKAGKPVRRWMDAAVLDYIRKNGLYGS
jgi:nicotinate-nucleotide adenylyltransferase